MKILVFSDSHGYAGYMLEAARRCAPDAVIHLGDGAGDLSALKKELPRTPVINVRGNCDSDISVPERRIIELSGSRLFICHGHRYGVKLSLDGLLTSAMCAGADAVLFGHTHIPCLRTENGLLILNPGSVGRGRSPSCAVLTLEEGAAPRAELLPLRPAGD